MNIKYKLTVLVLLFAIIGTVGCGKNEEAQSNEDMFTTILKSAPFFEQENLPEWLLIKISEIEFLYSEDSKEFFICKVRIFQGEWNKQIVYLIMENLSSCLFCKIYYENGENIVFNDTPFEDFSTSSKNWIQIYEYGYAMGF
ncbi:MAG: hypothetical protein LBT27_05315 [Prevotellaceae bacterium]|jgi:hypothetical protein|nr:hypothetical protein [Prevotellaceae bacterium]